MINTKKLKVIILFAIICFVLPLGCCSSNQKLEVPIEPTISATGYNESGSPFPSAFQFSIGDCKYNIPFTDKASRVCGSKKKEEFSVPVQEGANVWIRLEYLPYKGDIILIYDTQNDRDDWSAGMVTRLESKNLIPKWYAEILGFNTCPCLREGSYLYVTGASFIGKLDLDKGKYVWSHRLQNEFGFISNFMLPKIDGNKVIFTEDMNINAAGNGRSVVVDKESGRLLKQ